MGSGLCCGWVRYAEHNNRCIYMLGNASGKKCHCLSHSMWLLIQLLSGWAGASGCIGPLGKGDGVAGELIPEVYCVRKWVRFLTVSLQMWFKFPEHFMPLNHEPRRSGFQLYKINLTLSSVLSPDFLSPFLLFKSFAPQSLPVQRSLFPPTNPDNTPLTPEAMLAMQATELPSRYYPTQVMKTESGPMLPNKVSLPCFLSQIMTFLLL